MEEKERQGTEDWGRGERGRLRDRGEREAGNREVGEGRKGEIERHRRKRGMEQRSGGGEKEGDLGTDKGERYGTEEWWRKERWRLRDKEER
jgi:hypothetical protein